MKIRTMALWMSGVAAISVGAMGVAACSSDDSTGVPSTTKDASAADGTVTDTGTGTGEDAGTGDDTGTLPQDAAADCRPNINLHPVDAGTGPYCPFSSVGDAGNLTCTLGQHCCEPSSGTATCAASCTPDSGTDWECQGSANCATGVCCAVTTGAGQDPGCTYHFLRQFKATHCAASCAAGEIQVCENTSGECTSGTCQPTTAKGANFGICQP